MAQIFNSTFVSNGKGSYIECIESFGPENGCVPNDGFIAGAVMATNSTIDISQSRFEDNKLAADIGGAIFAVQDNIININGSVFVNPRRKA